MITLTRVYIVLLLSLCSYACSDGHHRTCAKLFLPSACIHSYPPCDADSETQVGLCPLTRLETISERLEFCQNTTNLSFAVKYIY